MKKKLYQIFSIIVLIIYAFNSVSAAPKIESEVQNIAPQSAFDILKVTKQNVDLVIITDYKGADLTGLKSKVNELTAQNMNSSNIKTTYIDDSSTPIIPIGSQSGTFPMSRYGIAAYADYTWSGSKTDENGILQTYSNKAEKDTIYLDTIDLKPGEMLPGGAISPPSQYWYEDKTQNTMFGGSRNYIYHFNGYPNTYSFWINYSFINGSGGSIAGNKTSWSGPTFSYDTKWSLISTYPQACTNVVKAYDLQVFKTLKVQPGSNVFILFALNGSSTDFYSTNLYNQNHAANYMLGNMREDNIGQFIGDTKAHVYSLCGKEAEAIKLSESPYKIAYSNTSISQNVSILDLMQKTEDSRSYEKGQYEKALNNIKEILAQPSGKSLDLVIATDKDPAAANGYLTTIKNNLPDSVDLKSLVLDNTKTTQIAALAKPYFDGEIYEVVTGIGNAKHAYLMLKDNGDLYVQGYNYNHYYISNQYEERYSVGLLGVPDVPYIETPTKVLSDVAQIQIMNKTYYSQIIAIKKDGTVWGCGTNFDGILDPDTGNPSVSRFVQIEGLSNIRSVKGLIYEGYQYIYKTEGWYRTPEFSRWHESLVFLSHDGKLYGKGYYRDFLFDSNQESGIKTIPVQLDISNVTDMDFFGKITDENLAPLLVASCSDGSIRFRGKNEAALNPGETEWSKRYNTFTSIYTMASSIKDIIPMRDNIMGVVLANNDLYVMSANNFYGTAGTGKGSISVPKKVLSNFKRYYNEDNQVAYFTTVDNKLYYCGQESQILQGIKGYPSDGNEATLYTPVLCSTISDVTDILSDSYGQYMFLQKADGTYFYTGKLYYSQIFDIGAKPYGQHEILSSTLQPVTPHESLQIAKLIPIGGKLYGLDIQGTLIYPDRTRDYSTTPDTIKFNKRTVMKMQSICPTEQVSIRGMDTAAIQNFVLRENSERYFIYLSECWGQDTLKPQGPYFSFGNLTTAFTDYLKNSGFNIYAITPDEAVDFTLQAPYIPQTLQNTTIKQMTASSLKDGFYYQSLAPVSSLIRSKYQNFENLHSSAKYILLDEDASLEYQNVYSDYESDPKFKEQFLYTHAPDYFENHTGHIANAGQWLDTPIIKFDKKGKYTIHYRAQDNPSDSNLFGNYRKWSNEALYDIYVHERPVALMNIDVTLEGSYWKIQVQDGGSYDNDHLSLPTRGITASEWRWKEAAEDNWHYERLNKSDCISGKTYIVSYKVKDMEGAWSHPVTQEITPGQNNFKLDIDFKAAPKYALFSPTIPAGEDVKAISKTDITKGVAISTTLNITKAELKFEYPKGVFTKIADLSLQNQSQSAGLNMYHYSITHYKLPTNLPDGTYNMRVQAFTDTNITESMDSPIQVYTPVWETYYSSKSSQPTNMQPIATPLSGVPDELKLSESTAFETQNTFSVITSDYTQKLKIRLSDGQGNEYISFYAYKDGSFDQDGDGKDKSWTLKSVTGDKRYKISNLQITDNKAPDAMTGGYTSIFTFDLYAVRYYPFTGNQCTITATAYDGAMQWNTSDNKHGLNPQIKNITMDDCLLYDFRIMLVRDLHLESYYRDPATGKYPDKSIYVKDMAVDERNFQTAGYMPIGFTSLTKGYLFEFEIDSKNFNGQKDEIRITPRFYVCTQGIPAYRSDAEVDLYWQNSHHQILKVGEGGHAPWKQVMLTKTQRTIKTVSTATWRGAYLIPGTAFAVPKGTTAEAAKQMFADNTYIRQDIIVNFEIKGYKEGVMKFDYNKEQWGKERGAVQKAPYKIGDVIRYDWRKSNLMDIKSKRNR